jgi:hypothetical protein
MQGSVDRLLEDKKALLLGESWSIFFGLPLSSSGYGIRDNAGVIEVKNAGGSWTSPIAENTLQLGTMSTTIGLHTLALASLSNTIVTGVISASGAVTISGSVSHGTYSASAGGTIKGYITLNDISGTAYKFAVLT